MPSPIAFAGTVPNNYDRYLGPVLFEPFARDLAQRLKKHKIRRLLEIACGTGRVTRHLLNLVPVEGELVATDLNKDMISLASSEIKAEQITWKVADALNLHFENESFDHVVCQFGVMFFPDKLRAFAEAFRVLQKGGRYVFNSWDSLENNPRIRIMKQVLDEVLGNEAPDFLEKGPHSFFDVHVIRELLEKAGFAEVNIETLHIESEYDNAADFMKGFVDGSPLASYLDSLDREVRETIRRRLTEEALLQEAVYGKKVPCQAFVVEAIKPY